MRHGKLIALTLVFILTLSTVSYARTLYAPDGRTINVQEKQVSAYLNVSWYEAPVVKMYAPDGRNIVVYKTEVAAYENVGWIDGRKTVTIYSLDGRKASVPAWKYQSYRDVGWYGEPVLTMYAPDGRTTIVGESEISTYKSVGWREPHEYYLSFTFSQLMSYYKNNISFVYGYAGGYFFTNPNNTVHFGFNCLDFDKDVYEMEASRSIPVPRNPYTSQCKSVFSSIDVLFPHLLTKDKGGIIPYYEIEKYFNTDIYRGYNIEFDGYESSLYFKDKVTGKGYLLNYGGDEQNNLHLDNMYIEVYAID